ncbi:hypothetical protein KFE25_014113 [Diacronema lutheri]|uniref:Uncharacterized protein n=1 Tax=Diacronema lutheri TaxID=2081491 RepID=A0A8J5X9K8_DIALT|nr:hypothetical protein KFE25_014113 [Diacronema lutheri]
MAKRGSHMVYAWTFPTSLSFAVGYSLMINGSVTWDTQDNALILFAIGSALQFAYPFLAAASLNVLKQMQTKLAIALQALMVTVWSVGFSLTINGTVDRAHPQKFLLFVVGIVLMAISLVVYTAAIVVLNDKGANAPATSMASTV